MSKPAIAMLSVLLLTQQASSHFIFVVPQPDGTTANVIMSETLNADDAIGIEMVREAHLVLREPDGTESPLTCTPHDAKTLRLSMPSKAAFMVHGQVDLGVMARGGPKHVLVYHPKAIVGDPLRSPDRVRTSAPVELIPVARSEGAGIRLGLFVAGEPKAESEITIIDPDGRTQKLFTNKDGLTEALEAAGRYGAWARHWEDKAGSRDGEDYAEVRHYATLVLDVPGSANLAETASALEVEVEAPGAEVESFPGLPEATSSFGAVALDG